ncbi:phosphoenolpyruvate carboxykinase (ATP) [Sediminibacillus massiliensis]|uniref:phosphoenolpyruvate carboxykinase (ATP) n=1 Tax=Sediminibacillus massiliensis TaxID=1926277 RepID=UPI00098838B3|nr:phosphoenolpyruvate carboxykinase (ATP) [Sediminibacillus massiliensis]
MGKIEEKNFQKKLLSMSNRQENLSAEALEHKILKRNEGILTSTGAVCVSTGKYTGRSPNDKFIVDEEPHSSQINWGSVNKPFSKGNFDLLYKKVVQHLQKKDEFFIFDGLAGADQQHQLPIKVITEYAWHNLFARQLFIRPQPQELRDHKAQFSVISAPSFKADPSIDGTQSEAFIIISFTDRVILIGGTEYAGEIKKSVFSVMNYLLPQQNILPMHCSANIGESDDVALFFGLSGTGKTTLSADPERRLIGDDEHGWSASGIFNIEGGCYAKCAGLSRQNEPQIYDSIRSGAILENVLCDDENIPEYTDTSLTENTRAAYPLTNMDNIKLPSMGGNPNTIIFLTADAFGVLPPVSKLTTDQAMYHFLSGYTSKLAGTERGITEPMTTFSACFGAPFLPLDPTVYARMLGEKIGAHNVDVFLVNTGWTGGAYGKGKRINLSYTRAMIKVAVQGELANTETITDPYFGLQIPAACPGVPDDLLKPWKMWEDYKEYEEKAQNLAAAFEDNFRKFSNVEASIKEAGPQIK